MNRGCKVESYSNKYFPNTSLTKTRQPLCLDDNKKRQIAYHGSWQVFLIFFSGRISQSKTSQLFLLLVLCHEEWTDTGKPSSLFHTWKSYLKHHQLKDFPIFGEIGEIKSQFLLGTSLCPLPLEFSNFSKNCDFSSFSQLLEKSQKLQKS